RGLAHPKKASRRLDPTLSGRVMAVLKSLLGKSDARCALNELVALNKDSESAYRRASALVQDGRIKETFLRHADQRAEFARELADQVREMGGEPKLSGSMMAKVMVGAKLAFYSAASPEGTPVTTSPSGGGSTLSRSRNSSAVLGDSYG